MDLRYKNRLANELAEIGFPEGKRDIEQTGSISDLLVRTTRHNGVQVQVNEDSGAVTVSAHGADDPLFLFGHLWETTFTPGAPADVIIATIRQSMLDANLHRADERIAASRFFA
ncbi:hypothetical protein [Nonomuraea sp. NPDC005650]|uniref:hypothetical protein n=1 Tax=Nonomuraea sp. NPDC005650 TaxID=3157045 RepID=UPI0033B19EF6